MMQHYIITPVPTFATASAPVMKAAMELQGICVTKLARRLGVSAAYIYSALSDYSQGVRIRRLIERIVRGEAIDWDAERAKKGLGTGRPRRGLSFTPPAGNA